MIRVYLGLLIITVEVLTIVVPLTTYAATVEIPTFTEEAGIDMPTGTDQFEYEDGSVVIEIPYKGSNVKINIDEYLGCVNQKEQEMKTLTEGTPGASAFLAGGRIDAMATCIDFNSENK